MEKLIELLKQIQELAGVGVDALQGAAGGNHGNPHGAGGPPPGQHGGGQPMDAEDRADGGRDEAAEGEPPLRK